MKLSEDAILAKMIDQVDMKDDDYDKILSYLIKKARTDFYTFVKLIAPVVLPETFEDGRHIELICKKLQSVEHNIANPKKVKLKTDLRASKNALKEDLNKEDNLNQKDNEIETKPKKYKYKNCTEDGLDVSPLRSHLRSKRLQIFVPPGSMKTRLASNLFPAWVLGRHPNWSFLAIGADFEFAVDTFGRPTKEIVELPQYQAIFPGTTLKKDVQGAGRWDTSKKGRFVARGAGQGLAGRRAHITICDDIMNEQTTDTDRDRINKWYQRGLRTRLLPNGGEIIINTRWHMDDLSGHILKVDKQSKNPWDVVVIPALLDEESSKLLRRKMDPPGYLSPGTSFWPELWPTERLLEIKQTMPVTDWEALYMQNPVPEEGTIIKKKDIRWWTSKEPPKCLMVVCSMDTAYSQKERADYSACTVWGVFLNEGGSYNNLRASSLSLNNGSNEDNDIAYDSPDFDKKIMNVDKVACLILLGAKRGRWAFPDLCEQVKEINETFKPEFFIIEDKGSGSSLLQALYGTDIPIAAFKPGLDKEKRLHFVSPFFTQGRVFFPKDKDWTHEVEEELLQFPYAKHDDYVDTISQAIQWLRDSGYLRVTLNDKEDFFDEDDTSENKKTNKGYWSALAS